jgi:hypothetical protein
MQRESEHGSEAETLVGRLWPSADYAEQVERLRSAVGARIFLIEIHPTEINVGACLSDTGHELLGIVEFPRPDPARGLAPHLILLDDGRGINLGRIARISVRRPFDPAPEDILYQAPSLLRNLLFRDRTLSKAFIAERSRALLSEVLGKVDVGRGRHALAEGARPAPAIESHDRD